jgi:hypothetical protein
LENLHPSAVKGWLVFLASMGPTEVPQGGQPCKLFAHSKKNDAFCSLGLSNLQKTENWSQTA